MNHPIKHFEKSVVIYALLGAVLWANCSPVAAGSERPSSILFYDLTYTSDIDLNDPGQVSSTWDDCHALSAIQGIVNRSGPRLYVRSVVCPQSKINVDDYWFDKLTQPGQWLHGRPIERAASIESIIDHFRSDIEGVVLYDAEVAATSNVASTIAGVENLLPIRYDTARGSLYSRLVANGPRLPIRRRLVAESGQPLFTGQGQIPGTDRPSTGSAKCDAYLWMKEKYLDNGICDGAFGAYYLDQYWRQRPQSAVLNHHCLTNHDFFISKRAFFFDLGIWGDEVPIDDPRQPAGADRETLKELLLSAYHHGGRERMIHIGGFVPWAIKYTNYGAAGGAHAPVPTEWEYARVISAYNGFMDADAISFGAMANASFFAHYPLQKEYPQKWVRREQLMQRGYLTEEGKVDFRGRDFVVFYVGDYDCAAWLYQRTPDIWDDANRGQVPLMWCISPALDRRAPMAMDYLRRTAGPQDYFASADNGAGYLLPGMLQEPREISGLPSGLDAWARHNKKSYDRWGLSITGFIIDAHGPDLNEDGLNCYASFSPNGIVPTRGPAALLHGAMPVLRHDHDVNEGDPHKAARHILERISARRKNGLLPFHWFRNILKSPTWYRNVVEEMHENNPQVELLDGPTFFELLRIYLENNPDC